MDTEWTKTPSLRLLRLLFCFLLLIGFSEKNAHAQSYLPIHGIHVDRGIPELQYNIIKKDFELFSQIPLHLADTGQLSKLMNQESISSLSVLDFISKWVHFLVPQNTQPAVGRNAGKIRFKTIEFQEKRNKIQVRIRIESKEFKSVSSPTLDSSLNNTNEPSESYNANDLKDYSSLFRSFNFLLNLGAAEFAPNSSRLPYIPFSYDDARGPYSILLANPSVGVVQVLPHFFNTNRYRSGNRNVNSIVAIVFTIYRISILLHETAHSMADGSPHVECPDFPGAYTCDNQLNGGNGFQVALLDSVIDLCNKYLSKKIELSSLLADACNDYESLGFLHHQRDKAKMQVLNDSGMQEVEEPLTLKDLQALITKPYSELTRTLPNLILAH